MKFVPNFTPYGPPDNNKLGDISSGDERGVSPQRDGFDVDAANAGTTIFFGGPILTMEDQQPEVEAMAIRDGKIIALGDRRIVLQYHNARTRMMDLQGCTLMPGFVDAHVHMALSAFTQYEWLNVSPPAIGNRRDMIAAVREASEGKRDGEWVIAYGYDSSFHSPGEPALSAFDLDKASTRHPIFVLEQSWDVAYVNHKAFELAGLFGDQRTDSAGPTYIRDGRGKLTGEIRGATSFAALARTLPSITFEQKLRDCESVVKAWAQKGCTTIYDAAVGALWGQEEVRLFLEMASDPSIPMRFTVAFIPTDGLPFTAGIKPHHRRYQSTKRGHERLYFAGIKFWADGIARGVMSIFDQPFLGGEENDRLKYNDGELETTMQPWHDAGWQLLVQADSSKAIEQALNAYDTLLSRSPMPGHRHRIEHCALIDDNQLARARQLGLNISYRIGDGYWGIPRNGNVKRERLSRTVPLASDLKRGLIVSLHSDSPATPVDPLLSLQTAVIRNLQTGENAFAPDQRIPIEQALKTITIYPAYQCFLENRIGSFAVGKLADMVVLDHNPCRVNPTDIAQIKVLETYVDGLSSLSR